MDSLPPLDFINEDDLGTFEGWLRYQAINPTSLSIAELAGVRALFEDAVSHRARARKVGRMKLKVQSGEYRYAVAVRDGKDLWLTLWVRRSPKGEFFVFQPRDGDWNPHSSLHADGRFHLKSHGRKTIVQQRQRPDSVSQTEHLGAYGGHGTKTVGAVCEPTDFTGVFEVPTGILGPRNGTVVVDLLATPGDRPLPHPAEEFARRLFTEIQPHILIRVFRQ